jgi:hypothetical protein
MSALPVLSPAAPGRPFIFPDASAALLARLAQTTRLVPITSASRLEVRPALEMVSSGIPELDALTGGLPRGCVTEICGPASSGRTSVLLAALSRTTRRGEVCALVDASDAFDPASAATAETKMERLLWIRCGKKESPRRHRGTEESARKKSERIFWESRLEQVMKVTDLLLQSNGFGMIALDLGDVPTMSARRIPLATWFRFRRAIKHTPTVLLVVEQKPIAGSCSTMLMQVSGVRSQVSGKKFAARGSQLEVLPAHAQLLDRFNITAEVVRSRLERKPSQSVSATFQSRAKWA